MAQRRMLTETDREEISRGIVEGLEGQVIAARTETLWRWRRSFEGHGVGGLVAGKTGPKGPRKLTDEVIARARALDAQGRTLAQISRAVGVSVSTVRVALGRAPVRSGRGGQGLIGADVYPDHGSEEPEDPAGLDAPVDADGGDEHGAGVGPALVVLPAPARAPGSGRWPEPDSSPRRRWCSPRARTCRWPGCC